MYASPQEATQTEQQVPRAQIVKMITDSLDPVLRGLRSNRMFDPSGTESQDQVDFWEVCGRYIQELQVNPENFESGTIELTETEMLVTQLQAFSDRDEVHEGIVCLYSYLTHIREIKQFHICEELLRSIDVNRIDLNILVATLMGTAKMPRELIPARVAFYDQVRTKYEHERGREEADEALRFLE